jgi:hypothetical protein
LGHTASHHRGVRGCAALVTAPVDPAAVPAEGLEPGEMRRLPFAGQLLGAVRVRAAYAAIPLEAFDRAGERLRAEEQAAYLQLLRLSWGEGRNFCRATKRELQDRLRLSERRLLRVLDVLVARGLVRPLHRDNRGTLWRVLLPREADGGALGDDVLAGRASPAPVPTLRAAGAGAAPRPGRSAAPAATPLARALAEARGDAGPDALAAAAREVDELLAEGQQPSRIAAAIEALRARSTQGGPARDAEGT